MKPIFFAVHRYEIIPCHLIARKDRTDGLRYAANSKRDNRRFRTAFSDYAQASRAVEQYEKAIMSKK